MLLCSVAAATTTTTEHRMLDGYFLPTDMKWIVQWERSDYKRRLETFESTGKIVERTYPNEEDYEDHMRKTGQLTDSHDGLICGGLYHSYILEEMFPPVMMAALKQQGMVIPGIMPGGPKRWYGAPMAAINRVFVVTGAPEMKLPRKEWDQLRVLQRLYSRKIPATPNQEAVVDEGSEDSARSLRSTQNQSPRDRSALPDDPYIISQPPADMDEAQDGTDRDARKEDTGDGSPVEKRLGKSKPRKRQYTNNVQIDEHGKRPCLRRDGRENDNKDELLGTEEESWCFGPQSTSDEKVYLHGGHSMISEVRGPRYVTALLSSNHFDLPSLASQPHPMNASLCLRYCTQSHELPVSSSRGRCGRRDLSTGCHSAIEPLLIDRCREAV